MTKININVDFEFETDEKISEDVHTKLLDSLNERIFNLLHSEDFSDVLDETLNMTDSEELLINDLVFNKTKIDNKPANIEIIDTELEKVE